MDVIHICQLLESIEFSRDSNWLALHGFPTGTTMEDCTDNLASVCGFTNFNLTSHFVCHAVIGGVHVAQHT